MLLDSLANLIIVLFTAGIFFSFFRTDGHWNMENGLHSLQFFTTLSNLLCAAGALCVLLAGRGSGLPYWVWLLKYLGTVALTVTLLTVVFFLGPTLGYSELVSGAGFYLHLAGPLLAILSFCFLERYYTFSFPVSLLGLLPVCIYGTFYMIQVIIRRKWEDFYGYNKTGKWPISFVAMVIGTFLICLLLRFLYNL